MHLARQSCVLVSLMAGLASCVIVPAQDVPELPTPPFPQSTLPTPGPQTATGLTNRFLWLGDTPARGVGAPIPDRVLAEQAQAALREHAKALGLTGNESWDAPVVHQARKGPYIVQFHQQARGHEVLNARISVALDHAATVRVISGSFTPHTDTAPFRIEDGDAVHAGLARLGVPYASLKAVGTRHGYQYFEVSGSRDFIAAGPVRVKPVHYPGAERLIPAYYLEVFGGFVGGDAPLGQALVVSAEDGSLLHAVPLVVEAANAYRVFADASGRGYTDPFGDTAPHPTGLRDGWVPSTPAPMSLITRDHAGISTTDPWLPAGVTETRGNNVDAYFKGLPVADGVYADSGWATAFDSATGDFRAAATSPGTFDYVYDPGLAASDYMQRVGQPALPVPSGSAQLNAKIVQAFYFTNELHDLFYDHGYDEVAGNTQQDNYGRGGLGGDPLLVVSAQSGVFAGMRADGASPYMFMGTTLYSQAAGDSGALDFTVLGHEWAHTMFGRLRPLPASQQLRAMNEGTADFVGFFTQVRETDRTAPGDGTPFSGAYASGAYFNRAYDLPDDTLPLAGSPGYPDNTYYQGVRRFPYSTSFSHNPLTFAHIDMTNEVPWSWQPFDWKLRSLDNAEVHSAGEIWGQALWQCARNLLADDARLSFTEAHGRMLSYLVAGLKLFPPDADFVEARNALLSAIRTVDETDFRLCRDGFAARGLGAGAVAPARYAPGNRGAIESFSTAAGALTFVDATLEEVSGGDGDGVLDVGETGRLTMTLKNTGFDRLDHVRIDVSELPGVYRFPAGATASDIALGVGEMHTASFGVELLTDEGAPMLWFPLVAYDDTREIETRTDYPALFTVNYDLVRDAAEDWLVSEVGFLNDWVQDVGPYHACGWPCPQEVFLWERVPFRGEYGYRAESRRLPADVAIRTVEFTAGPGPLRIILDHEYEFVRTPSPYPAEARGFVEYRVDGGPWVGVHLFSGSSAGTLQTDTVDLGSGLAGRRVELRLRFEAGWSFEPQPVHWTVSAIQITGATTPVFSSMYVDVL